MYIYVLNAVKMLGRNCRNEKEATLAPEAGVSKLKCVRYSVQYIQEGVQRGGGGVGLGRGDRIMSKQFLCVSGQPCHSMQHI